MARLPRVTVPGIPHHVVQRGNRGLEIFFSEEDRRAYLDLLRTFCRKANTQVWAYCLMPNHVHLILVPADETGLRRALGETHRRYTRRINSRQGCRGICGRSGLTPLQWTKRICCTLPGMWSKTRCGPD